MLPLVAGLAEHGPQPEVGCIDELADPRLVRAGAAELPQDARPLCHTLEILSAEQGVEGM